MRVLVTGSSGHLGEALIRTLRQQSIDVVSLDIVKSPFTTDVGSIADRSWLRKHFDRIQIVFHMAALHKPHVVTHQCQEFVKTNITGTLNLLELAVETGVESFIFTSTTSVLGDALKPPPHQPAAWITENVTPIPKNIYGVTKAAAEDLCQLFYRNYKLPCIVLRTSRFFSEEDDDRSIRTMYVNANIKLNEFLYRRVDIEDAIRAHLLAAQRAESIGFGKYIISATTPFTQDNLAELRLNAPAVVKRLVPDYEFEYEMRGWKMFPGIDRVYVNDRARRELGWQPRHHFRGLIDRLKRNDDLKSPLARLVGSKGYHTMKFVDGPYPVHIL
jgi:UDP-glucose 4-epimerase